MVDKWKEYFKVADSDIEVVPTGKAKVGKGSWEKMIQQFLDSSHRNQQWTWVVKKPTLGTARSSLERLTRGQGMKQDKKTIIPEGTYHGQVEVSVIGGYVYLVNVAKQKEWEISHPQGTESVQQPKEPKKPKAPKKAEE
jgi:hypothetical protein